MSDLFVLAILYRIHTFFRVIKVYKACKYML